MALSRDGLGPFVGLNLEDDPRSVTRNELTYAYNLCPFANGTLGLRYNSEQIQGRTFINATSQPSFGGSLYSYVGVNSYVDLAWLGGSTRSTLAAFADGVVNFVTGNTHVLPPAQAKPAFVRWNDEVWMFTGDNTVGFRYKFAQAGATVNITKSSIRDTWTANGTPPPVPQPTVAFFFANTLVLAGFSGEEAALIRWCEVADPTKLLSDAKALEIGDPSDPIVGGFEVAVSGGAQAIEAYAVILTKRRAYLLRGLPPTSTSNGSLQRVALNDGTGCVAKETICDTEYGVFWCSGPRVWLMKDGVPSEVGRYVKPWLERGGAASEYWHAAFDGRFYRLNVPGSVPGLPSENQSFQLWLDTKALPQRAAWWGPMSLESAAMYYAEQSQGGSRLISLFPRYDENVLGTYGYLEDAAAISAVRADHYLTGAVSPVTLTCEARSKEFDFGYEPVKKAIHAVELIARTEVPSTVSLTLYANAGGRSITEDQEGAAELQGEGFVLDSSNLDAANLTGSESGGVLVFQPHNGERFLCRTVTVGVSFASLSNYFPNLVLRSMVILYRPLGTLQRRTPETT